MRLRIPALAGAAALACLAAPARAQAPAGLLLPAQARLADARMRPLALRPAADPARELATRMQPRPPHLYYSIPLSAAMAFAGAAVGYGVGFVGLDCSDEGRDCGNGPDNAEYMTAFAGLALGAATGAHLGGLTHDSKGSFPATLAGAAVGALPILLTDPEGDVDTASIVSLVTGTAGAVIVDYVVRRPRH
ncbi:hypothetical protein [Longimicrobium sp.]|uniref:hypothetical protein n=1 Tax=Longimicrobium sp. TaxID=2029185 RepID=UPI002C55A5DF|nr:hypothetical protein [Longimicrobium sp.]HSU16667.1 hypothetical protein [Longimicrobium sp.]